MVRVWLPTFLFFALPAATFLWFLVTLILFLKTPKTDSKIRKSRKFWMLTPACLLGAMLISVVVLAILFAFAITHM